MGSHKTILRDLFSVILDDLVLSQNKLHCPVCLSRRVWKDGYGRRKNRCPVQRFQCAGCGKEFCTNTFAPWYWCKYHPVSIILFLWEFHRGESIRSLRGRVSLSENRVPSWITLWRWLLKFGSLLLKSYAKQVWPKVSRHRTWQTDENCMFWTNLSWAL